MSTQAMQQPAVNDWSSIFFNDTLPALASTAKEWAIDKYVAKTDARAYLAKQEAAQKEEEARKRAADAKVTAQQAADEARARAAAAQQSQNSNSMPKWVLPVAGVAGVLALALIFRPKR